MILDRFIVIEGIDGSGTSTQLKELKKFFAKTDQPAHFTCEPTPSEIGKLIRRLLKGEILLDNNTLALLFKADRYEHLYGTDGILSHIEKGEWVICDRYHFSTLAYQALKTDIQILYEQNREFPLPSITFFIDTPPDEADRRINHRNETREIYETLQIQQEVRKNYYKAFDLFKNQKDDIEMQLEILNGKESIEILFNKITAILSSKIKATKLQGLNKDRANFPK